MQSVTLCLRLYRRGKEGLSSDALQRKEGSVTAGGKALQLIHGVDLPVLGADAVLYMGGQMVKVFPRSGIVAKQDVEIPVICSHRITSKLGCTV